MNSTNKTWSYLLLSILLFYFCWGIPQFFNKYNLLSSVWNDAFFSIIFTGIAGCLIPVLLRNMFKVEFSLKTANVKKIIGLILFFLTLVSGVVFSEALTKTIEIGYSGIIVLKYILLFFPMTLGISLFVFLLIPRLVDKIISSNSLNLIVTSILTWVFFFIGFFIDSTFGNIELAIIMAFLGLFFGLSNWFTKNFWVTFAGFFITVLFNTLSEGKYNDYSLIIVLASTVLSLIILIIDIRNKLKRQNNA